MPIFELFSHRRKFEGAIAPMQADAESLERLSIKGHEASGQGF
jgi:hypothetical protein